MDVWIPTLLAIGCMNLHGVARVSVSFPHRPTLRIALYVLIWSVPLVGAVLARFAANESRPVANERNLDLFAAQAIAEATKTSDR
ncbi:MAG: hypothetical protein AAGJ86_11970 [Pseudomonadota bacterium]